MIIKLTQRNDGFSIWVNTDRIFCFEIVDGGSLIRCEREHVYVKETPEEIMALINPPLLWAQPYAPLVSPTDASERHPIFFTTQEAYENG